MAVLHREIQISISICLTDTIESAPAKLQAYSARLATSEKYPVVEDLNARYAIYVEEPTIVFFFLARYHQACIYSELSELEANLMLCEFVFWKTGALYTSFVESDQSETWILDCPTAVRWLLRTYATDDNISRAVNLLRSAQKTSEKDEQTFSVASQDFIPFVATIYCNPSSECCS